MHTALTQKRPSKKNTAPRGWFVIWTRSGCGRRLMRRACPVVGATPIPPRPGSALSRAPLPNSNPRRTCTRRHPRHALGKRVAPPKLRVHARLGRRRQSTRRAAPAPAGRLNERQRPPLCWPRRTRPIPPPSPVSEVGALRAAHVLAAAAGQVSHTPRGVPPGHRAHGVCAAVPRAAQDGHAAPPGRRAARWAGAPPESTPAADSLPCPAPPPPRASGTHLAQPLGYTPTPPTPACPRRDL